ncbi:hypothetical protein V7161_18750 [Neobacillus drentensis]
MIHAASKGGVPPENEKNIITDKNIWAGPIAEFIVDSAVDRIFQLYGK